MARKTVNKKQTAASYKHPESDSPMPPDVGTQAQFKKKKPPVTYRYDSSLSPALDWDGQNSARELGEWLLSLIDKAAALPPPHTFEKPQTFVNSSGKVVAAVAGLQEAIAQFKAISKAFLNWAGWRRAQLCGQQAEPITLNKLGAAISFAGEELQLSGRKMAFVGGHNQR